MYRESEGPLGGSIGGALNALLGALQGGCRGCVGVLGCNGECKGAHRGYCVSVSVSIGYESRPIPLQTPITPPITPPITHPTRYTLHRTPYPGTYKGSIGGDPGPYGLRWGLYRLHMGPISARYTGTTNNLHSYNIKVFDGCGGRGLMFALPEGDVGRVPGTPSGADRGYMPGTGADAGLMWPDNPVIKRGSMFYLSVRATPFNDPLR